MKRSKSRWPLPLLALTLSAGLLTDNVAYADAQADLDKTNALIAATTDPGQRATYLAQRGIVYLYSLREWQKAVNDFTEAIKMKESNIVGDTEAKRQIVRSAIFHETGHYKLMRGQALFNLKRYTEARSDLEAASANYSDKAELWATFAGVHYALGDYDKAVESSNKAQQLNPKYKAPDLDRKVAQINRMIAFTPTAGAYRDRGDHYAERHRDAKDLWLAIADYDSAIGMYNKNPELFALRARARMRTLALNAPQSGNRKTELDRLNADLESALQLDSRHAPSLYLRARLRIAEYEALLGSRSANAEDLQARRDALYDDLNRIVETNTKIGGSVFYLRARAERMKPQPDAQKILDDYSKAIELQFSPVFEIKADKWWAEPSVSAEAHLMRGTVLASRKEYDAAISALTVNVFEGQEDAATLLLRGKVFLQNRQPQRAIEDLRVCLAINPTHSEALMARGAAYDQIGHFARAQADFKRAIRLKPELKAQITGAMYADLEESLTNRPVEEPEVNAAALKHKNMGNDLLNAGLPHDAREAYEQALAIDPNYAVAYNNRGNAYKAINEINKAIADYDKAIELQPNDYRFHGNRAIAYRRKNLWQRTLADYTTAIELAPDTPETKANIAGYWGGAGVAQHRLKRYADAVKSLERSHSIAPLDPDALLLLALDYIQIGQPAKARETAAGGLKTATPEQIKLILNMAKPFVKADTDEFDLDAVLPAGDAPAFGVEEFIKLLEQKLPK